MGDLPTDWAASKTREILRLTEGSDGHAIEHGIRETIGTCHVIVREALAAGKTNAQVLAAILSLGNARSRHASAGDAWVAAHGRDAVADESAPLDLP